MVYIFLYNVIYIKSDFSLLIRSKDQKMVLIASEYCLSHLSQNNRSCFEAIHTLSKRDFHAISYQEVEEIAVVYIDKYGSRNVRLLTNEDSAQIACARLREKYNIDGYKIEQILPFVNKVISKQKLDNAVRIPKFVIFDKTRYRQDKQEYLDCLIRKIGFPMFVKPIDLVSSVETHRISDLEGLKAISERMYNHEYEFEIDEYINGDLFHCDAMIIDGKVNFFMVGKCSFALARFFEGYPVGSTQINDNKMFAQLKNFCGTVFKKLNCPSSAYHMEVFLEKDSQEFVFLEIGARTGGALITRVYDKLFGINIEETNYLIQMGFIDHIRIKPKNLFSGFLIFPKMQGRVLNIKKPIIDIEHEFMEHVQVGDMLSQAENLLDMSCSVIFWDKSYDKVISTFEYLKQYKPLTQEELYKVPLLERPEELYNTLLNTMPFLFWKDRFGRYQGTNCNQARNLGFESPRQFIGKTIFEILNDKKSAAIIDENDKQVMNKQITLFVEEKIGDKTYYSQKSPIYDNNNVIGMLGFSVDITEYKKKENILSNKVTAMLNAALKAVHDIRSPLAALYTLTKCCNSLPEQQRLFLRQIATNINNIANSLLNTTKDSNSVIEEENIENFFVSLALEDVINEKRHQYKNHNIELNYSLDLDQDRFMFIRGSPVGFNRALSNLINNSIDAFEGNEGCVDLTLKCIDGDKISILVSDNGKGMPQEIVDKIKNGIQVTAGKRAGHGLGLSQVHDLLRLYNGKISIESSIGVGTKIELVFPKASAPVWSLNQLIVKTSKAVTLVLDDDPSIHTAWDIRFEPYKMKLHHFTSGETMIEFINGLAQQEKQKLFVLCDFELIDQNLDGLKIIETLGLTNCSVLVTSNYDKKTVCDSATRLGVKVLPKRLVPYIPIDMSHYEQQLPNASR